MAETPFNQIKKLLSQSIPLEMISYLPEKWEKIGDIVVIKLSSVLEPYQEKIGEMYAQILHCRSVLKDTGGISGLYRKPQMELIFGSQNTKTIHKENSVRYRLDPSKVMFSSGNMDERRRMATISSKGEIIVDLFAGIGYFTLPIAVYSQPKEIFACEINPVAYGFLCENIVLNNVTSIIEPLLGDNREKAPKDIANRVIMGYIHGTRRFLSTALDCLKNHTGVIHYHDVFSRELIPDRPLDLINRAARKFERKASLIQYKRIKSYAPGKDHVVCDVMIGVP